LLAYATQCVPPLAIPVVREAKTGLVAIPTAGSSPGWGALANPGRDGTSLPLAQGKAFDRSRQADLRIGLENVPGRWEVIGAKHLYGTCA